MEEKMMEKANVMKRWRKKGLALIGATSMLLGGVASLAAVADTNTSNAQIEFTAGNLELVSVPSFDFGSHALPSATTTYTAVTVSDPLRVSDLRGSLDGWNVKAQLSGFTVGVTPTLSGASITLSSGSVTAVGGTTGTAPTVGGTVNIPSGGAATLVTTAAAGAGGGVWDTSWTTANSSIQVFPGNVHSGVATATMDWSLEDTP